VAEVLGDLRRYGDALAEYGLAIARDPRSPDGYLARGKFLLAIRMPREARMDFVLAHAIKPTPLTTLLAGPGLDEVASAEDKARTPADLEALAGMLRTAIERAPADAFAHFLLGTAYAAQRKNEAAAAEWQTAARLDPRLGPGRK
jgi:tetratricopeptide (TPR) repeat protein